MTTTLVRWSQSCVQLVRDGRSLVIDPGEWTEDAAFTAADAVLLTHDHADHADVARIRRRGCAVLAPVGADLGDLRAERIEAGNTRDLLGFRVDAVGGEHAEVLPGQPLGVNLGYVVDRRIYHPGDALHVPGTAVDVLLAPVHGPWVTIAGVVALAGRIAPRLTIGIHDGQLNDRGLASVNRWLASSLPGEYRWLAPGTGITLP